MRAVRVHKYGTPDGLRLDEIAVPAPGPEEILVRVAAASVNPVDWKVADGMLRAVLPQSLPYIPGGDFSGTVAALGDSVSAFAVGETVFGMTSTAGYASGAYAEFAVVKAAHAARKPNLLDMPGAAAVPLAALTAWQAVFDRAGLQKGQRILVHAGAGGVGGFAIQFARQAGAAEIITTCSAANAGYVRRLGATTVIDYRATAFESVAKKLDIVIDLMGGDIQARSYTVLRPGGVLVNAWGAVMQDKADAAGVRAMKVAVHPDRAQLAEIAGLIDAGEVNVEVARVFPLDDVGHAFALSRTGHARGKVVLSLAG